MEYWAQLTIPLRNMQLLSPCHAKIRIKLELVSACKDNFEQVLIQGMADESVIEYAFQALAVIPLSFWSSELYDLLHRSFQLHPTPSHLAAIRRVSLHLADMQKIILIIQIFKESKILTEGIAGLQDAVLSYLINSLQLDKESVIPDMVGMSVDCENALLDNEVLMTALKDGPKLRALVDGCFVFVRSSLHPPVSFISREMSSTIRFAQQ